MTDTQTVEPGGPIATMIAEREPLFQRVADKVSYGMGTPLNIGIWIVIVVGWTLLFAVRIVNANGSFLPR
jgi:hypothetical protein